MKTNGNYIQNICRAIIIAFAGVFIIDYFSHLWFSNPMETPSYFFAKCALYVVFSFFFLMLCNLEKREARRIVIGGIVVALLWGTYYNILPAIFDFYPFGISLEGLSFLNMGLFGTGIAFGIVHTVAFVGGYYISKPIALYGKHT